MGVFRMTVVSKKENVLNTIFGERKIDKKNIPVVRPMPMRSCFPVLFTDGLSYCFVGLSYEKKKEKKKEKKEKETRRKLEWREIEQGKDMVGVRERFRT